MQELRVIGCSLTPGDMPGQAERADHLRRTVLEARREGDRIELDFGPNLDEGTLGEFVAAESDCCSFFDIHWDTAQRRLAISAPPDRRPALDAMAGLLGV